MQQRPFLLRLIFLCLLLVGGFGLPLAQGQSWTWALSAGGTQDASGEAATVDGGGNPVLAGIFRGDFAPAGRPLPTFGGEDIYLASSEITGGWRWAISAGSSFDDSVADLATDPQGNLLLTGAFWQLGRFGDQELIAAPNIKGIFLAKYGADGSFKWALAINGTQLKEVSGVVSDLKGNIYLCGFFGEELIVDTLRLKARGNTDLFVLKFDPEGRLLWASSEGFSGDTRAMAIDVNENEEVVIGGFFNGATLIAGQTLTANTSDRDVFLARYDRFGKAVWARKAGGVHDDELVKVAFTPAGEIVATGYLVGVMRLDENISIQSQNGNPDFYLLRYSADGTPISARVWGGTLIQQSRTLAIDGEEVIIGGIYQGEMSIDGVRFVAGAGFGSFLVAFNRQGSRVWEKNLPSGQNLLINDLAKSSDGAIYAVGAFEGRAEFDTELLESAGGFDPFLARYGSELNARFSPGAPALWRVFPNPSSERVFIEPLAEGTFHAALFDALGRRLWQAANPTAVDLSVFPPGMYQLILQQRNGSGNRFSLLRIR